MADSCDAGIAQSAFGGVPGKAIRFSGSGTSLTIRSTCRGSARRGMKNPLAPASAKAFPRSIASSTSAESCVSVLMYRSVRALMKNWSPRAADRLDALRLQRERVQTLAADDLVLEIAADRARRGQADNIVGALVRVIGIGAFESKVSGSSVDSAMFRSPTRNL